MQTNTRFPPRDTSARPGSGHSTRGFCRRHAWPPSLCMLHLGLVFPLLARPPVQALRPSSLCFSRAAS
ncbi:hypothetical protein BGZ61DRAFT_461369, partial [Ilyonectria robusta]|uniref:uncharacterized protein n=1 Tax=Ilyonectria robusta TaxID=1079257 RepID=UPI001E8E3A1E